MGRSTLFCIPDSFNATRTKPTSQPFRARLIVPVLLTLWCCAPAAAGSLAGEVEVQIASLERAGLLVDDFVAKPAVPQSAVDNVVKYFASKDVPVFFVPLLKGTHKLQGAYACPGTFDGPACYILIDSEAAPGSQLATLLHEWGHLRMPSSEMWEGEAWAETVAWLALRENGIDTTRSSMSYLYQIPATKRNSALLRKEKAIRAVAADLAAAIRGR